VYPFGIVMAVLGGFLITLNIGLWTVAVIKFLHVG